MVENNPHKVSTMGTGSSLAAITDASDFPHTGLIKSLSQMARQNLVVRNNSNDFDITQASSGNVVQVSAGSYLRDGKLYTASAANFTIGTTSNDTSLLAHSQFDKGYHLLVINASNAIKMRQPTVANKVPDYTVGDTIIAVIEISSTTSDGSRNVQFLTTDKAANSLSIAYDNSNVYTEALSIESSASGDVTIESKVSDKDIIVKGNDGGASTTIATFDVSEAKLVVPSRIETNLLQLGYGTGNAKLQVYNAGDNMEIYAAGDSNGNVKVLELDAGTDGAEANRIATVSGNLVASQGLEVKADGSFSRGTTTSGMTRTLIVEGARNATGTDYARLDFKNYDSHGPTSYVGARISALNDLTGVNDGTLTFSTNNANAGVAEAMRITDEGKVGIGETDPSTLLHLSDAGAAEPSITLENTGTNASEPEFVFLRSGTAAASQDIGHIKWKAKDDGGNFHLYGSLMVDAQDETGGTEDGRFIFYVASGGSDSQEILRLSGSEGFVFNDGSADLNFRVESNGNANMLFVDAGKDGVAIGTGTADQNSALTVEGSISLDEISAPTNTADRGQLYTNADNELHMIDGAGTDTVFLKSGKHSIWVPSSAMTPTTTAGCSALTQVEMTAGRPELQVLDFAADADDNAQFTVAFPKSWNEGTVTFQPFWTVTGTNTGTAVWNLTGISVDDNYAINSGYPSIAATGAKAHSGTSNDLNTSPESGALTITNASVDSVTYFRLSLDTSSSSQTGTVRLIGLKLFYDINAGNDE